MKRLGMIFLVLVAVAGCRDRRPAVDPALGRFTGKRIDAHLHVSNRGVDRLIALMDAHGIGHAVNVSGGFPGRGLEQALAAAKRHPGRLSVMCNLPWRAFATVPDFVPQSVRILEACRAAGAVGFKIEKGLGLGYRAPDGTRLRVDDPRLDPIFAAAGRLRLPVLIHTGDPMAFWKPTDAANERFDELTVHPGWSLVGRDVPPFDALWEEFATRVRRHPGTTFIGAHFGNAPEDPDRVGRLLDESPNLVIDTAARIPEIGRRDPEAMRRFFVRHQDRILFGTDLGVGPDSLMLGSSGADEPGPSDVLRFFSASWRYLETRDRGFPHPTPIQGRWTISGIGLPPAVLAKVYRDNSRRVLGLKAP
jgi:predicted TIM-barrel fold metal-dependent hydrolase